MSLQSINKGFVLSDGYIRNWRDEPITEKQLQYIYDIQEFSIIDLPYFNGTTKGEACDYIEKYREFACMNPWAIEHGYD